MHVVAYLLNRYPETSLTAVRREIDAVANAGTVIHRFAHRPSLQPLANEIDRDEANRTQYLAEGGLLPLLPSLFRATLKKPIRFTNAVRIMLLLGRPSLRHIAYLIMACRLVEHLTAVNAEHLHTHFAQNAAAVAMLARSLGGPPWTMTVHGYEDLEPSYRRSLALRARAARTTIAISHAAAEATRVAAAPDTIDVRIIGMGVNDIFLEAPVQIRDTDRIVCIGRLDWIKGQDVLIDAIQLLRERGISPTIEFIGDGPCKDELMTKVDQLGLTRQFSFCGWQGERTVRKQLDRSSFLVLPSRAEGLPVSVMEAFARGRPVIASDVGGISELVHDAVNGALVTAGNARCLSDAIRTLMAMSPNQLFEVGLRGRADVQKCHDAATNARALAAIWQETSF